MSKKFEVKVREVYDVTYVVYADDMEEAEEMYLEKFEEQYVGEPEREVVDIWW